MKKLFLLLCLIFLGIQVYCQSFLDEEFDLKQVKSPQVADMLRFDKSSHPLATGCIDQQIPLLSVEDPDFDIGIGIRYNSSGFKPTASGNFVGLNWSLVYGGVISREVKGMPDDVEIYDIYNPNQTKGFLAHIKNPIYNHASICTGLLHDAASYCFLSLIEDGIPRLAGNDKREISSDIYNFTFGSHSGKFTLNFDGTTNVVSYAGGSYKIDLTNYNYIYKGDGRMQTSITIITDDGYRYKFGGDVNSLEYTALSWPEIYDAGRYFDGVSPSPNIITAFHLTEITAPNGRRLQIFYRNTVPEIFHIYPHYLVDGARYAQLTSQRCQMNYVLNLTPYEDVMTPKILNVGDGRNMSIFTPENLSNEKRAFGINYSLNKIALIEEIVTDDKSIVFHYSPRQRPFVDVSNPVYYGATPFGTECGAQLDSVNLHYMSAPGNLVQKSELKYFYKQGRIFLGEIWNSGTGRYSFSYGGSLPEPATKDIDHWGFWVGQRENSKLIPDFTLSPNSHEIEYTSKERDPGGVEYYKMGMLNEIIYPTGGRTTFDYEPHMYYRSLVQDLSTGYSRMLKVNKKNINLIAGGVRIKRVTYHSENNNAPAKKIEYLYKNDPYSDESSGILTYMPRYVMQERGSIGLYWIFYDRFVVADANGINPNRDDSHIEYSTIIEKTYEQLTSRPDSTVHAIVYGMGPYTKQLQVYVDGLKYLPDNVLSHMTRSQLEEVERKYSRWTIKGSATNVYDRYTGQYTLKTAKLTIKNSGFQTVREYIFTDPSGLAGDNTISFNPVEELGPGMYFIYMEAEPGGASTSFQIDFPGTGIYMPEGPYKITRFSDHYTNSDIEKTTGFYQAYATQLDDYNNYIIANRDENFFKRFLAAPEDRSHERGKILSESLYKKDDKLVQKTVNTYGRIGESKYSLYIDNPKYGNTWFALYYNVCKIPTA